MVPAVLGFDFYGRWPMRGLVVADNNARHSSTCGPSGFRPNLTAESRRATPTSLSSARFLNESAGITEAKGRHPIPSGACPFLSMVSGKPWVKPFGNPLDLGERTRAKPFWASRVETLRGS